MVGSKPSPLRVGDNAGPSQPRADLFSIISDGMSRDFVPGASDHVAASLSHTNDTVYVTANHAESSHAHDNPLMNSHAQAFGDQVHKDETADQGGSNLLDKRHKHQLSVNTGDANHNHWNAANHEKQAVLPDQGLHEGVKTRDFYVEMSPAKKAALQAQREEQAGKKYSYPAPEDDPFASTDSAGNRVLYSLNNPPQPYMFASPLFQEAAAAAAAEAAADAAAAADRFLARDVSLDPVDAASKVDSHTTGATNNTAPLQPPKHGYPAADNVVPVQPGTYNYPSGDDVAALRPLAYYKYPSGAKAKKTAVNNANGYSYPAAVEGDKSIADSNNNSYAAVKKPNPAVEKATSQNDPSAPDLGSVHPDPNDPIYHQRSFTEAARRIIEDQKKPVSPTPGSKKLSDDADIGAGLVSNVPLPEYQQGNHMGEYPTDHVIAHHPGQQMIQYPTGHFVTHPPVQQMNQHPSGRFEAHQSVQQVNQHPTGHFAAPQPVQQMGQNPTGHFATHQPVQQMLPYPVGPSANYQPVQQVTQHPTGQFVTHPVGQMNQHPTGHFASHQPVQQVVQNPTSYFAAPQPVQQMVQYPVGPSANYQPVHQMIQHPASALSNFQPALQMSLSSASTTGNYPPGMHVNQFPQPQSLVPPLLQPNLNGQSIITEVRYLMHSPAWPMVPSSSTFPQMPYHDNTHGSREGPQHSEILPTGCTLPPVNRRLFNPRAATPANRDTQKDQSTALVADPNTDPLPPCAFQYYSKRTADGRAVLPRHIIKSPSRGTGVLTMSGGGYQIRVNEVVSFLGRASHVVEIPEQSAVPGVCILQDRMSGKTGHVFAELVEYRDAHRTVYRHAQGARLHHKLPKIGHRVIELSISTIDVFLKKLFPKAACSWTRGRPVRNAAYVAAHPLPWIGFISAEELRSVVIQCQCPEKLMYGRFNGSNPERVYQMMMSSIQKLPWNMPQEPWFPKAWVIEMKKTLHHMAVVLSFKVRSRADIALDVKLLDSFMLILHSCPLFGLDENKMKHYNAIADHVDAITHGPLLHVIPQIDFGYLENDENEMAGPSTTAQ